MLNEKTISVLQTIFNKYKDVIAVYLFGSYTERREQARDVDLAILLTSPATSQVDLYLERVHGLQVPLGVSPARAI